MSTANPFLNGADVRALYATPDRIATRTHALRTARIAGAPATGVIADLAEGLLPSQHLHIADIGCGRGSTTLELARRIPTAQITALDLSPTLVSVAAGRLSEFGHASPGLSADFRALPFRTGSLTLVVAAFCLYHAPDPSQVLTEIRRCLTPDGAVIIATKSLDSYTELDHLVAATNLDPDATRGPSLYDTFHSDNAPELVADQFAIENLRHDEHRFRFTDEAHLARYLATNPKYRLPAGLRDPHTLTSELQRCRAEVPIVATSTVTYISGRPNA